jgi:uncharacterized MAPEG superfamily protein
MLSSKLCLFIVAFLPFVWTFVSKFSRKFDNAKPREYLAIQTGWRARANAAQQNSWEALGLFVAALLVAWHGNADAASVDRFATWFVVARLLHGLLYTFNFATLRSLIWTGSLVCIVMLFHLGGAF